MQATRGLSVGGAGCCAPTTRLRQAGGHREIWLGHHKAARVHMWWRGKRCLVRPEESGLIGLVRRIGVRQVATYYHDLHG